MQVDEQEKDSSLNISYEELGLPESQKVSVENLKEDKRLLKSDPISNFANQTPDYFSQSIEQFNNNLNDDLSDSGYANRTFETNLDEIFESLTFFISNEKNKVLQDKESLSKEIKKFIEFKKSESEKIKREKQKWEVSNIIANNLLSNCDIINLEIGGKQISTTKQTLLKYPNSNLSTFILNKLSQSNGTTENKIVIERDAKNFLNIISYLRNDKYPNFKDDKEYQNFLDELDYWQIPLNINEINKYKRNIFIFDEKWCAKTIDIDKNYPYMLTKFNQQHGIVFCTPCISEENPYIEFKISFQSTCKNKNMVYVGLVDKAKYKLDNLTSTYWRDCPSSNYWDIWNMKLIKIDENGVQIGCSTGYGCQCQTDETIIGIKYDYENRTVSFYKNGVNCGIAFTNVKNNLTPSLDLWFEEGTVEIMKTNAPDENNKFI
jgi:hypothetical protein